MKKILLLFAILAVGVANAQVSNSTGQLTGSSYGVSELRSKIEKGGTPVDISEAKGSPYLHDAYVNAHLKDYKGNPLMVKLNMYTDEFETSTGHSIKLEGDVMTTEQGEWMYKNGMWLLDVSVGDEGIFVHFSSEYEEAVPAANPKVRDVPAKWHKHMSFYEASGNGMRKLSRKEAKPYKKALSKKQPKKVKYEHKPPVFKQRGFGNTNHNAPGHVCDETCH